MSKFPLYDILIKAGRKDKKDINDIEKLTKELEAIFKGFRR